MSLDDVIKAGKTYKATIQLGNDFKENPGIDALERIISIEGSGKSIVAEGLDPNLGKTMPAAFHQGIIRDAQSTYGGKLIEAVQSRDDLYLGDVAARKDYQQIATALLMSNKPSDALEAVNSEAYKAHKGIHKAAKEAENPAESYKSALKGIEKHEVTHRAFMALGATSDVVEAVVRRRYAAAMDKLNKTFEDRDMAVNYLKAMYDAADDKGKKNIALAIGSALS